MATYNTPLITTQGLSLLKAEISGNDSVTFTKIVFSSDDYSQTADSSVQALTALSSLDLTATAHSFTDVNGNLKIRAVANNQNTTSAFYIKTYGLYGKNNAGTEMLIAVSTAQNANFVPAYNGKQTNQIAYTFNIAISSTNNITLSSSTDVDVTQADLAGINSAVNSNASSLTAQQSSISNSLSSSIANNSSAINSLSNASITYQGKISSFNQGNKQGLYKYFDGTTSSTLTVIQYNDVLIQTRIDTWDANGATFADDNYAPKMRLSADGGNTWSAWSELATQYDVQSINSKATSLANSLATQTSNMSTNIASNASAISSNANNLSSAINSVSVSNNAVSSSIASTVSVNQSNIANNSSAISNLQSSVASNSSAISNATSLASTANSNAVGAGLSVQTLESDTFRFQGKINNSNLDVSNYQNGVSNGWWSLSGVTINGLSGFSGYGIMSRTSDIYNITSNSGSQSATYVQVQVIDSLNETIYYNIFSYSKWVGWKQVATADGTLQFMGAVPGNTLSQVVNSGIYDLQGRSFTDYKNNIWGQLIVTVTGGVVNQTIRNNTGNMWIESVNGWGISGWKQVV